jgi:bacteriocin-like protein
MDKQNLLSQAIRPSKHITVQDLSTHLIELSEKDLQQIVGGGEPSSPGSGNKKQDWICKDYSPQ